MNPKSLKAFYSIIQNIKHKILVTLQLVVLNLVQRPLINLQYTQLKRKKNHFFSHCYEITKHFYHIQNYITQPRKIIMKIYQPCNEIYLSVLPLVIMKKLMIFYSLIQTKPIHPQASRNL